MRKEKTLFIIGLWVMILSFSGFPLFWRNILFVLTGISIIYLAYLFYLEFKERSLNSSKTFIDNVIKE